ncbi:MAG: hypothetical protein HYX79_08770 [Chloroflexi bacterium]|nr:hypothetical protein [Chloroflexota bacterium]
MIVSYRELIEDAQWFCDQAENTPKSSKVQERFSTSSILFSFMALESFINDMMSDFTVLPAGLLTAHELGFLAEKAVELADSGANTGKFVVTNKLRYQSLEYKIMFLVARFSGDSVDKGSALWQRFQKMKDFRDSLTHPRKEAMNVPLPADAGEAVGVAKDIIQLVSQKVWKKKVQF